MKRRGNIFMFKGGIKKSVLFYVIFIFVSSSVFADYTISSGSTIDASTITNQAGVLTINGTLNISSSVNLANFTSIIVNAPNGQILWSSNNASLTFNTGVSISIDPSSMGCQPTNGKPNQRLIIGTTVIAIGKNTPQPTTFTFQQFNQQGGLPTYTVSSNSPVCSGSSVIATVAPVHTGTGVTYSYQWSISPVSGIFSYNANNTIATITPASGTYTITCTATANTYQVVKATQVIVNVANTWLGITTNWSDAANWCPSVPTSAANITIPVSTNYPIISSASVAAVNNITIASGASFQVLGTLGVSGTITNNGTLDITNGTLSMNGANAQTIDGSAFYNKTINNLIDNNTSGSGLSVSSTLNDTLKISGALTFGNSVAKLNTNDNLNLLSTANGTASVGALGAGNSITGKAIVDRYINVGTASGQHLKSWQLLSVPTTGQTIKQSWMENQATTSGYGTYITSPNGTAAGFDAYSVGASMKYYDPSSAYWVGVSNTNNSIYNTAGYMIFIRGDRTVNGTTVTTPTPTILRSKGNLLTGTQPALTILAGAYQSIGNPYASPVDFSLLPKTNIDNLFYTWDPYLYGSYGYGGYQTITATNNWKPVPGGTSAYPSASDRNNIQSGQAFFVHSSSATAGSITFNESSKSGSSNSVNLQRKANRTETTQRQFLRASLYTSPNPDATIADGNVVAYDSIFSDSVDGNDAIKIMNSGENFGIIRYGKILSVEARAPLISADTIFYQISNFRQQTYQLRFAPENMQSDNAQAFLVDNFLNTSTIVSLKDTTLVNITVTSNPASSAADRFKIVYKMFSTLPVKLASVTATKKGETICVGWNVQNESSMQEYQVERSSDANNFSIIGKIAALNKGTGKYNWTDNNPLKENNYYRIASVSKDGEISYSPIVKVVMGNPVGEISVFPNPIENGVIHLQFLNQPTGNYSIRLINSLGQIMLSTYISHTANNTETIHCKSLTNGIYNLEIKKPGGTTEVIKLLL